MKKWLIPQLRQKIQDEPGAPCTACQRKCLKKDGVCQMDMEANMK